MQELGQPLVPSDYEGKNILVLTGAGISVDSGIAPYWGKNGAYTKLQEEFGGSIEEVLCLSNFKRKPHEVWKYMKRIFSQVGDVKPNIAHEKLVRLEQVANDFTLVTQNCDMLHTDAGSQNVLEIHGNAKAAVCTSCGEREEGYREQMKTVTVPVCPCCGSKLRPDVVLFEEFPRLNLPELEEKARKADILIVVGTQAYFSYITAIFNAFVQTPGSSFWVDIERPDNLESNWMIMPAFTYSLNYYQGGSSKFFTEMLPDL